MTHPHPPQGYDLIGDIHGYADPLVRLLEKLDYTEQDGVWRHPTREVIFLGDFIDRGPHQRAVIDVVRPMIDSGAALAVMGNHEFNALGFHTPHPDTGEPLRPWSKKNRDQHDAFISAYEGREDEMRETLDWFRTLPMWLDLGALRVIHACWDPHLLSEVRAEVGGQHLTEAFLVAGSEPGTWQHEAIDSLLKGKEIDLPDGKSVRDKGGNQRHRIRVRWWDSHATTYREAHFGPESVETHIPDDPIEGDHLVEYSHDDPPCFVGHYWLEGEPAPLAPNIACLDYSVAKEGGKLVAYRWDDGDVELSRERFVSVDRM
ncbi:metallophosphoesterase [Lentisalinibacter salinarum]|uniref:metallophosphoesterase n=1 Tax=Lentisalinibacter salinarum TaxID=2992239 RepID=UPI00386E7EE2